MGNNKNCIWCQCCYPVTENKWACDYKKEFVNEDDPACDFFIEVEKD